MVARPHHRQGTKGGNYPKPTLSVCLAVAAFLAAPAARANTSFFADTGTVCTPTSPCWQAGDFGMLVGLGAGVGSSYSGTLKGTAASDTINGDVGVGTNSFVNNGTLTENWGGPIDFSDAGSVQSGKYFVPSGNVLTNTTVANGVNDGVGEVATALSQIMNISDYWSGQTGTTIASNKLGAGTNAIGTVGGGIQIFTTSSINTNHILTITGGANDLVIINISGTAKFTKNVELSGGITADQVLFNLTNSGTTNILNMNGGGAGLTFNADVLVRQSYSVSNATINGRLMGGHGTLTLGTALSLNAPVDIPGRPVPEPTDAVLVLGGLGSIFCLGRRRLRPGS